jgi:uroporphyrinogen decarboxylase
VTTTTTTTATATTASAQAGASTTMTPRARMMAALASAPVDRPPIWMMRQAGRYLPEYRAVREGRSFLEMVRTPELAAEVTLQPITRYGFDAAILFSDILTVPEAMGLEVTFPGGGPQIAPVVRSSADVEALRHPDVGVALRYVGDAMRLCRAELGPDRALLGFAGAPWTLAAYMVEGAGSKSFSVLRAMVWQQPELLAALLDRLADVVIDLLLLQIEAGADAVQLFDTWAGELHDADYRRVALPSTVRIVEAIAARGVPLVLFARHPGHLTDATLMARPTAIGMDWRVDLDATVAKSAAAGVAVQGNLDPAELFAPVEVIARRVREIHGVVGGRTGHIMNLGHGVWPQAPLEGVAAFVSATAALAGQAGR